MYIELSALKSYLAITVTEDDALLTACIQRATAILNRSCGRSFEASADTTRAFDGLRDVSSTRRTLYLGDDLCQLTAVVNGDGTSVPLAQLVTEPRGRTPFYALTLKSASGLAWTYSTQPEDAILVTGRWGYSVSAPSDIAQAALRLATYLYRQRDTVDALADGGTSADGVVLLPARLPTDVSALVMPYQRLVP
jgi:hypothetical protein